MRYSNRQMLHSVKVKILWALVLLLYAQGRQVRAQTRDSDRYTDDVLKQIKEELQIFKGKYDVMKTKVENYSADEDQYGSEELLAIQHKLDILLSFRQIHKPSDGSLPPPQSCSCDKLTNQFEEFKTQFNISNKNINEQLQTIPKKKDFNTLGEKLTNHLTDELKKDLETNLEKNQHAMLDKLDESHSTCKDIENVLNAHIENFTNSQTTLIKSRLPNSCTDAISSGNGPGVYQILIFNKPTPAYCDQYGRMMIQHQMKGSEDFDREWSKYRNGFGNPKSQYWFGLENVHVLTTSRRYELHIDLVDFDDVFTQVVYDHFEIGGESNMYRLNKLGEFSGNQTENRLKLHINMLFSTTDKDNDQAGYNCAEAFGSGWWYTKCHYVNLNLPVKTRSGHHYAYVLNWNHHYLREASMFIKLH